MAEWFKRGTVNTFYRGSIPLDTLLIKSNNQNKGIWSSLVYGTRLENENFKIKVVSSNLTVPEKNSKKTKYNIFSEKPII